MVREFESHIQLCAVSTESGWDPLTPSLSAPPLLIVSLSLKNKYRFKKNKRIGSCDCGDWQVHKLQGPAGWRSREEVMSHLGSQGILLQNSLFLDGDQSVSITIFN